MEFEPLLTSTRWNILEILSEKRQSPLELASALKMTLANISQQLRLLEMAGLVKTQRISQREKGKPRLLYSIADDFGYLVLLAPGNARKSLISLNLTQKATLSIWLSTPSHLHASLTAFLPKIEGHDTDIQALYLSKKHDELTIVSESKDVRKLDGAALAEKITVRVVSPSDLRIKPSERPIIIFRRGEVAA